MQIVYFKKSDYHNGRIRNAERYGVTIINGFIEGVTLVGELREKDEETYEANRAEVSCSLPASSDNAIEVFRQAANEVGGFSINEEYIRMLFDEGENN